MSKKTKDQDQEEVIDFENLQETLVGREVTVGLRGANLAGVVEQFLDDGSIVLVVKPTSSFSIQTDIVHTVIHADRIEFIQFITKKTPTE